MIATKFNPLGKDTSNLPYDTEVEYLESTGTQWIDTEIPSRQSLKIGAVFENDTDNSYFVYGVRSGDSTITCATGASPTNLGYVRWGANAYAAACPQGFVSSIQDSRGVTANGIFYEYNGTETVVENSSITIALFAGRNSATTVMNSLVGKIYSCKIWDNSILILDLIPVRKSNVGYMYDKVSGQLFGNSGTGDFILGPDKVQSTVSTKSYVQDGLVHQYDAIENIGYGEHSDETVVWHDLVSGKDALLQKTTGNVTSIDELEGKARWLEDAFEIDGDLVRYSGFNASNETIPSEFTLEGSFQLEFTNGVSDGNIMGVCGQYQGGGVVLVYYKHSRRLGAYAEGDFFETETVISSTKKRQTVTFKDNVLKVYLNGNKVLERQYDTAPSFIGSANAVRPLWKAYYDYNGAFRVFNFMVYNRALTDTEIAHNYAVDKERFGL